VGIATIDGVQPAGCAGIEVCGRGDRAKATAPTGTGSRPRRIEVRTRNRGENLPGGSAQRALARWSDPVLTTGGSVTCWSIDPRSRGPVGPGTTGCSVGPVSRAGPVARWSWGQECRVCTRCPVAGQSLSGPVDRGVGPGWSWGPAVRWLLSIPSPGVPAGPVAAGPESPQADGPAVPAGPVGWMVLRPGDRWRCRCWVLGDAGNADQPDMSWWRGVASLAVDSVSNLRQRYSAGSGEAE
jgi:hypothetical protein